MSFTDALQILFWVAFGLFMGWWVVFGYWRVRGEITRRVEGEAPLRSSRAVIWRDPGSISPQELEAGPCGSAGAPSPPFHFIEEHDTGSQPCVSIRDAAGHEWRVKWGHEVHTETFGTRLAWALGYFAEPTYFLASGTIAGTRDLRRAKECIDDQHRFTDARFEEHDTGSQPCVSIRDAAGHEWRVKWGHEVHTETFGTRLAWALGYFAEPTYFLASGTIAGTRDLRRAKECIDDQHRFTDARFE